MNISSCTKYTFCSKIIRLNFLILSLIGLNGLIGLKSYAKEKEFSFTLFEEPHSLDPAASRGVSGSYLFNNIYRSLYRYHPEKGLIPEGADKCDRANPLTVICKLNKNIKFSDGSPVYAEHYIKNFKRLLSHNVRTTHLEQLFGIKNALEIIKKEKKVDDLGILAKDKFTLVFYLSYPDKEFEYRLISPLFSPIKSDFPSVENFKSLVNNGPFVISDWKKHHNITLKRNPYYKIKDKNLIQTVKIYFAEDELTAKNLYRTKRISFLRRIKSSDIPTMRGQEDFIQLPVARFDYIGFGPQLKDSPHLRKALSLSLNFPELKQLYQALGMPGCPALANKYYDTLPCLNFDLVKAQKELALVPKETLKKPLELYYSKLGGDDHFKGMQWFQNQWKKNLKIHVELKPIEQGMFVQNLRTSPPSMFRKGVGLDRPTCLAAHEIFTPGNSENYIKLEDDQYMSLLTQLIRSNNPTQSKKICTKLTKVLIDKNYLIPLGEIHFSMLLRPGFSGLFLNELNQLDLTDLK
ncbi:MAG: hypothetical protein KDD50_01535 [Bdellovibrionales bacterium]|nr:hypothetical protein [Bdellovibrionales bacterium]